jgi:hypothetical protein
MRLHSEPSDNNNQGLTISIPKSPNKTKITAIEKVQGRKSRVSSICGGAAEFIEAVKDGSVATPRNLTENTPGPLSPTKFKKRADALRL